MQRAASTLTTQPSTAQRKVVRDLGAGEDNRDDEEAEAGERAKPASSRPGKKSGQKRSSTKEDAGAEVGIVEDGIPF